MRGRGIEKTGEEDARRRGGQQRGGTTSGHRGGTAVRKVGGRHGVGHQSMEMRLYGGAAAAVLVPNDFLHIWR